jgi:hypothetical protein
MRCGGQIVAGRKDRRASCAFTAQGVQYHPRGSLVRDARWIREGGTGLGGGAPAVLLGRAPAGLITSASAVDVLACVRASRPTSVQALGDGALRVSYDLWLEEAGNSAKLVDAALASLAMGVPVLVLASAKAVVQLGASGELPDDIVARARVPTPLPATSPGVQPRPVVPAAARLSATARLAAAALTVSPVSQVAHQPATIAQNFLFVSLGCYFVYDVNPSNGRLQLGNVPPAELSLAMAALLRAHNFPSQPVCLWGTPACALNVFGVLRDEEARPVFWVYTGLGSARRLDSSEEAEWGISREGRRWRLALNVRIEAAAPEVRMMMTG